MPPNNFICEFSNPVNLGTSTPDFEYSELNCTNTSLELIQNAETGAEFYIQKDINYGETIIIIFLLLFAIFGIIKLITDFFIPKRIDFRK